MPARDFDGTGGPHTSPFFVHQSGPAPLGVEGAYVPACGSLECRQGRGEVCETGCVPMSPAEVQKRIAERQAASPQARGERWANWIVGAVVAFALAMVAVHIFAGGWPL